MKSTRFIFLYTIAAASAAVLVGCATTQTSTQNRENMLVASGFKAITPKTPAQQQKLQGLPPGKVTMIQRKGKAYYIFPDSAHNVAYVGGPKQYRNYQQLRAENKLTKEISKPLRCIRIQRCSGVSGAEEKASGDQWPGRDRSRTRSANITKQFRKYCSRLAVSRRSDVIFAQHGHAKPWLQALQFAAFHRGNVVTL